MKRVLLLFLAFGLALTSCKKDDELKSFVVTFMQDSDVFAKVDVKDSEMAVKPEEAPTKDGFTFLGWYLGDEEFDFSTPITENVELTAKWSENSYMVSFKTGTINVKIESLEVKYGETITKPEDFVKSGFIFQGWYLGDEEFDFSTPISETIELVAKWKEIDLSLTYDNISKETFDAMSQGSTVLIKGTYTKDGWNDVVVDSYTNSSKNMIDGNEYGMYSLPKNAVDNGFEKGKEVVMLLQKTPSQLRFGTYSGRTSYFRKGIEFFNEVKHCMLEKRGSTYYMTNPKGMLQSVGFPGITDKGRESLDKLVGKDVYIHLVHQEGTYIFECYSNGDQVQIFRTFNNK